MNLNTASAKVLHALEDYTVALGLGGATVTALTASTSLSESTVRKHLKLLAAGGFATKNDGGDWRAVSKHEESSEDRRGGESVIESVKKKVTKPTSSTTKAKTQRTAGRPRDPGAEGRDEKVLQLIRSGKATDKVGIATELSITNSLAYLSIYRLKAAGRIQKTATGSRTPSYAATANG